jgi:hypothetical protein
MTYYLLKNKEVDAYESKNKKTRGQKDKVFRRNRVILQEP